MMAGGGWSYATLEPEQVALVIEAERTLGGDLVMAYEPSTWGTVDPETIGEGLDPAELERGDLEYLQGVERRVGGVLVAYRRHVD